MVKQTRLEARRTRRRRLLKAMLPRVNNHQQSIVTGLAPAIGVPAPVPMGMGKAEMGKGHMCSGQVMEQHKDRQKGPPAFPSNLPCRPIHPSGSAPPGCRGAPLEDIAYWEAVNAQDLPQLEQMKTCAGCVITQSRSTRGSCRRKWRTKSQWNKQWSRHLLTQTDACLSMPCSARTPARLYRPAARREEWRCTEVSRAWRPKVLLRGEWSGAVPSFPERGVQRLQLLRRAGDFNSRGVIYLI